MMKLFLLLITSLLPLTDLFSQSISLPAYHQGQYEVDTVFNYFGDFPFNGVGSINFGGNMPTGFVTGVDFKLVVDTVDTGGAPGLGTVVWDSSGTNVAMVPGDTLAIPINMQLFAGAVGFHIIVEGTPTTAGENYLCDLGYAFTLGNDWGMIIWENSQTMCEVGDIMNSATARIQDRIQISPNPFTKHAMVDLETSFPGPYEFRIIDLKGQEVRSIPDIQSHRFQLDRGLLPAGLYFYQVNTPDQVLATGKLLLE